MINVFAVGVHIGMSTNATQVLSAIIRQLTGVHVAASKLNSQLGTMRMAIIGAGAAFAGWEMLKGLEKLTEQGVKYNQQLAQMKMANYSPAEIAKLDKQAGITMQQVPGTNLVDNIKGLQDLRNVSGSVEHAVELSNNMAKVNAVLANITGKPAEEAGFKFMKFLEDAGRMIDAQGKFDVSRVEHETRWMEAVISATNGRVTGDTMFQFRQSGKAAVNSLSEEGLTNLVPLIMSLGPVAVGTAIQGLGQQLLGGVMLKQHTIGWLQGLDAIDPSKVTKGKGGNFSLSPGAVMDEQSLLHDPTKWIREIDEHMAKLGMSIEEQVAAWRRSGLRTPIVGLAAELTQNDATNRKEVGNIQRAGQKDQFDVMNAESPTFRITKFTEAWNNLQIALGKTVDVTMFLVPLTDALNWLAKAAVEHPEAAKDILELAGGIAALTALSGGMMVVGIALRPLASGIGLLVGMGTGIAAAGVALVSLAGGITAMIAVVEGLPSILKGAMDKINSLLPQSLQDELAKHHGGNTHQSNSSGHGHEKDDATPAVGKQSWLYRSDEPGVMRVAIVDGGVHVLNPGDIGRAVGGGLSTGINRPSSGPSYQDYRMDLPAPGVGVLA